MEAPMAPGPAISGVARGKTDMSRRDSASRVSSSVGGGGTEVRAKTISMPMSSSENAACRAQRCQGDSQGIQQDLPNRAKLSRIMVAIRVPAAAHDQPGTGTLTTVRAAKEGRNIQRADGREKSG